MPAPGVHGVTRGKVCAIALACLRAGATLPLLAPVALTLCLPNRSPNSLSAASVRYGPCWPVLTAAGLGCSLSPMVAPMQGNAGGRSLLIGVFHELFSLLRDPLAFLDTMPMWKSHMQNCSDKKSNWQAVCVIALITVYMASVVTEWLLCGCEVSQPLLALP